MSCSVRRPFRPTTRMPAGTSSTNSPCNPVQDQGHAPTLRHATRPRATGIVAPLRRRRGWACTSRSTRADCPVRPAFAVAVRSGRDHGAPSSACCLRRAFTPPRPPRELADQAGEAEHIALAIQPDSSFLRRQRVHSVRERTRRIRTEACNDGLAVVVRRQKVDAMDHEPRAVCLRAILARTKQRVANSNRNARRTCSADVDLHRHAAMWLPWPLDGGSVKQTKIIVLSDVQIRIGDPIAVAIAQTGSDPPTCGQAQPGRSARVRILGKPVEDGPASLCGASGRKSTQRPRSGPHKDKNDGTIPREWSRYGGMFRPVLGRWQLYCHYPRQWNVARITTDLCRAK